MIEGVTRIISKEGGAYNRYTTVVDKCTVVDDVTRTLHGSYNCTVVYPHSTQQLSSSIALGCYEGPALRVNVRRLR